MNTLKYIRNKHEIVKRINKIDSKYTIDFLMRWTKKQLLNYYNGLIIRKNHQSEREINNAK